MNQKRDVRLVVLGVVLLIFIAGCDGKGDVVGGAPTTPFLGGSQGLDMNFLRGSPPDEVSDGGTFPFQVIVSLKNLGEYDFNLDTNQVEVNLIGILASDFGVSDSSLRDKNPEDVPTPRQRDSEGDIIEPVEVYVEFPSSGEFNFGGSIAGNTPFTFRAEVCYRYQTEAVSEICVLENMIDVADDAICDPSETKRVFSSGSPVQVNSFRQNVAGRDKIQFSFDIVQSGSGDVFIYDGTSADCPKDPSRRRMAENKVKVRVDTGLSNLKCVGLSGNIGSVTLVNGRRTITCTQDLPSSRSDYKKNVDITIDFNYLDSVDKGVLVKHLLSSVSGGDGGTGGDGGEPGDAPTIELIRPSTDEWQNSDFELEASLIASTENPLLLCTYTMDRVQPEIEIAECRGKAEYRFERDMFLNELDPPVGAGQHEGVQKYHVTLKAVNDIGETRTEFKYNIDLTGPDVMRVTPSTTPVYAEEEVTYSVSADDVYSLTSGCWLILDDDSDPDDGEENDEYPMSLSEPCNRISCDASVDLTLNTARKYYLRVRCEDNAGNSKEGGVQEIDVEAPPIVLP